MVVRAHHHFAMRHHHPMPLAREVIQAGALGGLIGGVAMALLATIYDAIAGVGFWMPIRAIAATVLGHDASTGAGPVLLGLVIHLAVSIAWGIFFAAITPRELPPAASIAFGTFGGLTILVVMSLVVLPLINPIARARLMWGSYPRSLPVLVAFVIHLLYGFGLALVPGLRRRLESRRTPLGPAEGPEPGPSTTTA